MTEIPLHKPFRAPEAAARVQRALLEGPGSFGPWTEECERWLEKNTGTTRALLTTSGTAALHCCALLLDLAPGDEVLMSSWNFPSAASAFLLRGAVPVFVDIRADTLNLDERLLRKAITERTRAILVTHYAGVGCEMDTIMALAAEFDLRVVEDNAQGLMARYRDRPLGSIGDLAALSFHDTKNLGCGEGGALLVNDPNLVEAAEYLRDKGTNRLAWQRGQVPFYQWMKASDAGPPAEITAALLSAQLECAGSVTVSRLESWERYRVLLPAAGTELRIPKPPEQCRHNGHIFHLRAQDALLARAIQENLAAAGIQTQPHYRPLHTSPAGQAGKQTIALSVTNDAAETLLRLPLWPEMPVTIQQRVVEQLCKALART